MALNDEDKQWLAERLREVRDEDRKWMTDRLREARDEDRQWMVDRLREFRQELKQDIERVETSLLTEFHKWASPTEARQRSHSATLRALDLEMEALSERVKKLEP